MDVTKKAASSWLRQQGSLGRRVAAGAILLGLVGILLAIIQAGVAAFLLRALIRPAEDSLTTLALLFAVLAIARAAVGALADRSAFAAGAAGRRRLRSEILGRLLAIGPSLLRREHSAALSGIVVDRIEALDGLFARWIPAATLAVAGPALVLLAALIADPFAALILFLCGLFVPIGMALAGIGAAASARSQMQAMARLQTRFVDRMRGIGTIVLAGRTETEAAALKAAADDLRRGTMRILRVAFLSSAALDCAAAIALIAIAITQGRSLIMAANAEGAARALFLLLLVPEFFAPLRSFTLAYQDRMGGVAAAEAVVALPPAVQDGADMVAEPPATAPQTVAAHGISIAFEDVHLSWDKARGKALDGVTFRLPAGGTLILAGPSGAGKSTVIEILLGFVRPDAGKVLLNGMEISSIVPQALSRLTAWIGQRPVLFATSIRENIRFARPEASAEELAEAIRLAHVGSFVEDLPEGLETVIGEGGYGLSGGQAQRVAIARAFLKNAPLLLLDEPTAHLDPATEAEVLESLKRLAIGRTVLVASHSAQAHLLSGRRLNIIAGRLMQSERSGVA
jgi:ATP-binding cassette subfamily C protein CydD